MQSYVTWLALAFLATMQQVIKNPGLKAQMRSILLRIRDAITLIYEPEQLQGSVNQRVDVGHFVRSSLEKHATSAATPHYAAGTFDLTGDEQGEDAARQQTEAA